MSEYDEGDLIEAVKGDTVIRARLQRDPAGYKNPLAIFTVALHADVRHLEANGYKVTVLEKAAPPLPTEPGFYLTGYDYPDVFELRTSGVWFLGQEIIPEERVRHDGGRNLTRLEPVPVTVQKVIDYLVSECANGWLIEGVRKHFGVS